MVVLCFKRLCYVSSAYIIRHCTDTDMQLSGELYSDV
jgi:hypothetical protein